MGGRDALRTFQDEPGGHRWQRVPPTEKRGRVQTSTVTVAVFGRSPSGSYGVQLRDEDLEFSVQRGTGPGGQKRNKTESCVQVKHLPTGTVVRCDDSRDQRQNRKRAVQKLQELLEAASKSAAVQEQADDRKAQVGSGQRGDKRRTVRCQDGQVNDHVDGRTWRLKEYLRGEW